MTDILSYTKTYLCAAGLALLTVGGICTYNSYNPPKSINFSQFPDKKKIPLTVEDYVSLKGKTTQDYDMLEIYKCDQMVPKNTEMIVEDKGIEGKCHGIALIPK